MSPNTVTNNIEHESENTPQSIRDDVEQNGRTLASTVMSIHIPSDVYGWRPAELQAKQITTEQSNNYINDPDRLTSTRINVQDNPIMEYSTDYYNRIIAPVQKKKAKFQQKLHALGSHRKKKITEISNEIGDQISIANIRRNYETKGFPLDSLTNEASHQKDDNNNKDNNISPHIAKDHENGTNNDFLLQDIDESGQTIIRSNLSDIPYLHEASILFNLAERHSKELPYTRAGNVLIAMNPQKVS